jgi:hypothetical protein
MRRSSELLGEQVARRDCTGLASPAASPAASSRTPGSRSRIISGCDERLRRGHTALVQLHEPSMARWRTGPVPPRARPAGPATDRSALRSGGIASSSAPSGARPGRPGPRPAATRPGSRPRARRRVSLRLRNGQRAARPTCLEMTGTGRSPAMVCVDNLEPYTACFGDITEAGERHLRCRLRRAPAQGC